jgi:hypothetical protein
MQRPSNFLSDHRSARTSASLRAHKSPSRRERDAGPQPRKNRLLRSAEGQISKPTFRSASPPDFSVGLVLLGCCATIWLSTSDSPFEIHSSARFRDAGWVCLKSCVGVRQGRRRREFTRWRLRFLKQPLCWVAESLRDHFALFGTEWCSSD